MTIFLEYHGQKEAIDLPCDKPEIFIEHQVKRLFMLDQFKTKTEITKDCLIDGMVIEIKDFVCCCEFKSKKTFYSYAEDSESKQDSDTEPDEVEQTVEVIDQFSATVAVCLGHIDCLVYLSKHNIRFTSNHINIASANGYLDCLDFLSTYVDPRSGFEHSIRNNHIDCVRFIMKKTAYNSSMVRFAVMQGQLDIAKELAKIVGINSALDQAIVQKDSEFVKYCIQNGATVGFDEKMIAIRESLVEITEILFKADPSTHIDYGIEAVFKGNLDIVKLLIGFNNPFDENIYRFPNQKECVRLIESVLNFPQVESIFHYNLERLKNQQRPLNEIFKFVIKHGELEDLEALIKQTDERSDYATSYAQIFDRPKCLSLLLKYDFPAIPQCSNFECMKVLAQFGKLKNQKIYTEDARHVLFFAKLGYTILPRVYEVMDIDGIKYLYDNNATFPENVTELLSSGDNQCLKFMVEKGFPVNSRCIYESIINEKLDNLKYLLEIDCPRDECNELLYKLFHDQETTWIEEYLEIIVENFEILECLVNNRFYLDKKKLIEISATKNKPMVLKYLIDKSGI